jgi:bacterioferritin
MKDNLGMQSNGSKRTQPDLEARPNVSSDNDRQSVISLLNEGLSMELECVLRYRSHYFASPGAGGVAGVTVAAELLEHSNEELAHADRLAKRITQLGGVPIFVPKQPAARVHDHEPTLREMLMDDLAQERLAVNNYASSVRTVGDSDPTTRRLLEDILAQEEDHVEELEDFLRNLSLHA